jgi:hypothetical protein
MPRMLHALVAVVLAAAAAAQTFAPTEVCAVPGTACGADAPCCDGAAFECRSPVAGGGASCVARDEKCYAVGAQCGGGGVDASKPCCGGEKVECVDWEGDPEGVQLEGKFCMKKRYEENERCGGEKGHPWVAWRECEDGLECVTAKGGLWGRFCLKVAA